MGRHKREASHKRESSREMRSKRKRERYGERRSGRYRRGSGGSHSRRATDTQHTCPTFIPIFDICQPSSVYVPISSLHLLAACSIERGKERRGPGRLPPVKGWE
jgi:hypothetical protein